MEYIGFYRLMNTSSILMEIHHQKRYQIILLKETAIVFFLDYKFQEKDSRVPVYCSYVFYLIKNLKKIKYVVFYLY